MGRVGVSRGDARARCSGREGGCGSSRRCGIPGDSANTHHDEHGHHGADRGEEGDGARLGATPLRGAGPPASPRGDPTRGEHDGRPLVAGPLGGSHFSGGRSRGTDERPRRARNLSVSTPKTRHEAASDGLAGVRGCDDPGRRPRAVARRGVPAREPSLRLSARGEHSLVKNIPHGQIVSCRNKGVIGARPRRAARAGANIPLSGDSSAGDRLPACGRRRRRRRGRPYQLARDRRSAAAHRAKKTARARRRTPRVLRGATQPQNPRATRAPAPTRR